MTVVNQNTVKCKDTVGNYLALLNIFGQGHKPLFSAERGFESNMKTVEADVRERVTIITAHGSHCSYRKLILTLNLGHP